MDKNLGNRWNIPHTVRALHGKHIAMKKPKKSGSEYYNYKGNFCLVLLALVNAEYKFLWVDMGSNDSSSYAQLINHNKLRRKNGTLGLPLSELLGPGGPNLHYFMLGDNTFALMPWMVKPYTQKTTDQGGENSQLQDIQGGQQFLWNISEQIQGTSEHHETKARSDGGH